MQHASRVRSPEKSLLRDTHLAWWRLRDANNQPQVEKQQRRGEEQTVNEIENAADSGQEVSGIFDARAALNNRLGQISHDRGKAEKQSKDDGVGQS